MKYSRQRIKGETKLNIAYTLMLEASRDLNAILSNEDKKKLQDLIFELGTFIDVRDIERIEDGKL